MRFSKIEGLAPQIQKKYNKGIEKPRRLKLFIIISEGMKLSKTSQNPSVNISVSDSILKLVLNILRPDSQLPKEILLVKLLANIDSQFFPPRLCDPVSFDSILRTICEYYLQRKQERIVRKFLAKKQYCDRFVHTFQLVFDLALTGREEEKNHYLEEIIKMTEQERQILNNFIYDLEKRSFIGEVKGIEKDIDDLKDEEYQQLYKQYQELKHNYLALLDNYDELKFENEKIVSQLNSFQLEKQFMCQQIGLSSQSDYRSIADKYCEDLQTYKSCCDELQKELANTNNFVDLKQKQIQALQQLLAQNSSIKSDQAKEAIESCKELEQVIVRQHTENQSLKDQIKNKNRVLEEIGEEIEKKEELLKAMKVYRQKFLQAKALHSIFKENFEIRRNFPNQEEGSFAM